ncbi:hypothetical protein [Peribacillus sp. NPDC058002]|uniref:hypothetical protein n=1 Tax=Peribacillus sp. NPDC058002 TaxID=3346301 RepID=UPI0036DED073
MSWINDNKDWIFSGVGVVLGSGLLGLIFRNIKIKNQEKNTPNQSIKSGNDSNNIQGGNDVKVTIGDKNVRK